MYETSPAAVADRVEGSARRLCGAASTAAELLELTRSRLVATADRMLLAVYASTGRLLWRRRLGFHVAAVIDYDGVVLAQGSALGDSGDRLGAVDGTTCRVCASAVLSSLATVGMTSVQGALWITTVDGHVIAIPRLLTRLFVRRCLRCRRAASRVVAAARRVLDGPRGWSPNRPRTSG